MRYGFPEVKDEGFIDELNLIFAEGLNIPDLSWAVKNFYTKRLKRSIIDDAFLFGLFERTLEHLFWEGYRRPDFFITRWTNRQYYRAHQRDRDGAVRQSKFHSLKASAVKSGYVKKIFVQRYRSNYYFIDIPFLIKEFDGRVCKSTDFLLSVLDFYNYMPPDSLIRGDTNTIVIEEIRRMVVEAKRKSGNYDKLLFDNVVHLHDYKRNNRS